MAVSQWVLAGGFVLASCLGLLIGLERELRGKAAGLRTFALVALGAAAFTGISLALFPGSADRVIQGIVTGIGFLGAGVIFQREQGIVEGLTTAASAWAVAAVGVLVGTGAYVLGVLVTVLVLAILEVDRIPATRKVRKPQGRDGRSSTT